jgi:hypothetical protein
MCTVTGKATRGEEPGGGKGEGTAVCVGVCVGVGVLWVWGWVRAHTRTILNFVVTLILEATGGAPATEGR